MSLEYVTLTGKIPGGGGAVAWLALSGWTPAATDGLFFPPRHDPVTLAPDGSFSVPGLLANDSGDIAAGSYWTLTVRGIEGVPSSSWSFFLNYASGAEQDISGLAMVSAPPPVVPALPVPEGVAAAGDVPVAKGDGQASAWGPAGTVTSVSGEPANGFTVSVADGSTTPQVEVGTSVTGLLKGNGTGVSAAAAGTDYLAPAGDGSQLTGITPGQVGAASTGALTAEATTRADADTALGNAVTALANEAGQPSGLATLDSGGRVPAGQLVAANIPVLNQSTTGTASNLSGTPALPDGTAATTQAAGDDSTKLATDAFVTTAVAAEATRAETAEGLALQKSANLGDLASAATALANLGAAPGLRLIYADLLAGVDPTGATDSTAALVAAQTAAGSSPYRIVLGAGTYKLGTSEDLLTFGPEQGITGPGAELCTVSYKGSGTCVNAWDSAFNTAHNGGRFGGFTLNGAGAGAGAAGLRWGDLLRLRVHDVVVTGFAGAGSKGLYGHNVNGWSEEGEWTAVVSSNNTSLVYLDTGSFDYSSYQFVLEAQSGQDGIRMENDASVEGCRLQGLGNFIAGAGNTAAVIAMDRLNPGTGTCRIDATLWDLAVEPDGATGTGHYTVLMLGGTSGQLNGTGVLRFLAPGGGIQPFRAGTFQGGFSFSGIVDEPGLGFMDTTDAIVVQGASQWAQAGSLSSNYAYNGMYVYPGGGDFQAFILPNGAITVAGFWGANYARTRRIVLLLKQPASGAAGTVTWPSNVKFTTGYATLSTAAGAVDKIVLTYFPSESTWYAELTTAYAAPGGNGFLSNPMTTLGDSIYGGSSGTPSRLAGNTSTTRMFWRQAGTGSASAAPAWDTLQLGDLPAAAIPPYIPADTAQPYQAWNYDPGVATSNATVSAGVIFLVRVSIRQALATVTGVVLGIAAGGTLTSGNLAGLYNSSGTLLGTTADQSAVWNSIGVYPMAFSGGALSNLAAGFCWVAFVWNGSVSPAFARNGGAADGRIPNAGFTAATCRYGSASGTGHTSLANITPSANSLGTSSFWAALY